MKIASSEVKERVVSYFKEHLDKMCDASSVEVYVGGNPSVGDGHLYLVLAKDKRERLTLGESYDCWTCWNDSTQSLNFGHYHLTKQEALEKLMEFEPILDGEEYFIVEDGNGNETPELLANTVQLKKFATGMLKNFFEARSDYGDPVSSLMPYVPAEKIPELLEDYNYTVTRGTKEDYNKILEEYEKGTDLE